MMEEEEEEEGGVHFFLRGLKDMGIVVDVNDIYGTVRWHFMDRELFFLIFKETFHVISAISIEFICQLGRRLGKGL